MELADAIRKAKRVYLIGNGGSYANAVHICNDLLACGVKAYTLDPATLTASANDYGYDTVFVRWIATVGDPADLLIALSGSGRSSNIVKAVRQAKHIGMATWALVGQEYGAGEIADKMMLCGTDMQSAEEHQLRIGHEVMRCLKSS